MSTSILHDFSTGNPTVITGQRYGLTNLVDLAGVPTNLAIGSKNPSRRYVNSRYPFQFYLVGRDAESRSGVTQTPEWNTTPQWMVKDDITFLEQSDWMGNLDLLLSPSNFVQGMPFSYPNLRQFYRLDEYEARLESFLKTRLQDDTDGFVLLEWATFPLNFAEYTGWGTDQVSDVTVTDFASKFDPAYASKTESEKALFVEQTVIPAFNLMVELIITTAIRKAKEDAPGCKIGFTGFPTGVQRNKINRSFGYDFPTRSYDPRQSNDQFSKISMNPKTDYGANIVRTPLPVVDQLDFFVADCITSYLFFPNNDSTPLSTPFGIENTDPTNTISQIDKAKNRFSRSDYQIYLSSNIAEVIRLREFTDTKKPIFLMISDVIRDQFERSLPNYTEPTANPYGNQFVIPFGDWVDTSGIHGDLLNYVFDNEKIMMTDAVRAANRNGLDGIVFMLRGSDDSQSGSAWSYAQSVSYFLSTYAPIFESELLGERYMLTAEKQPTIAQIDNSKRGALTVTWNHIPGAERYYLARAKSSRVATYDIVAVTQNNFVADSDIQDNLNGSNYYYKVMAIVDNQFTPFSTSQKVEGGYSLPIGDTAKVQSPPVTGDLGAGSQVKTNIMQGGVRYGRPIREPNIVGG